MKIISRDYYPQHFSFNGTFVENEDYVKQVSFDFELNKKDRIEIEVNFKYNATTIRDEDLEFHLKGITKIDFENKKPDVSEITFEVLTLAMSSFHFLIREFNIRGLQPHPSNPNLDLAEIAKTVRSQLQEMGI